MTLFRTCTKCFLQKPLEEFAWKDKRINNRHAVCKECTAKRSSDWYYANREWHIQNVTDHKNADRERVRIFIGEYLSTHPCVDCGEKDTTVLEFDHVRGKNRAVATLIRDGATVERVMREIELCEVRCANCHRRKTAKERGWFRR